MAHPKIGNLAPNFKLPDQDGNRIELRSFRDNNPVVIFFYPKALTPGCTTQACGIRDTKAELEKRGVVVFGISPDAVARLPKFIDKHDLNFTLLSDEDHATAEKYGCWGMKKFMGKEFMGLIRTSFIIDANGQIARIMRATRIKGHAAKVLVALDEVLAQVRQ